MFSESLFFLGQNVNQQYFQQFRDHIIGIDQDFVTPYGQKKLVYTEAFHDQKTKNTRLFWIACFVFSVSTLLCFGGTYPVS